MRYSLVHKEHADGVRAAQANGTARADIDPDLKAIEVIAFLNGLETSWLLNPSLPVEDVATAWRDSQRAQMTVGPSDQHPTAPQPPDRRRTGNAGRQLRLRVCLPEAGQGPPQLPAGADSELDVHLAEMPFNGPGAEE